MAASHRAAAARRSSESVVAAAGPTGHAGPTAAAAAAGSASDVTATAGAARAGAVGAGAGPASDPLLSALLGVVAPLEEAGYAYCAVGRTAAWLHGANSMGPDAAPAPAPAMGPPPLPPAPPPQPPQQLKGQQTSRQPEQEGLRGKAEEDESRPQPAASLPSRGCADLDPGRGDGLDPDLRLHLELELELQWDQMKTVHALFSRPGSGWATSPLRHLPAGRATFVMAGQQRPQRQGQGQQHHDYTQQQQQQQEQEPGQPAAAESAGAPAAASPADGARQPASASGGPCAVRVRFSCAYNTGVRANPARVRITPHPPPHPQQPPLPPRAQQQQPHGQEAAGPPYRDVGCDGSGPGGGRSASLAPLLPPASAAAAAVGASAPDGSVPQVWSRSLYGVATEAERAGDTQLAAAAAEALAGMQRELSAYNTAAWGRDTAYDAWVARFGPPREAAARLLGDPGRALGPLLPCLQLPDSPPLAGLSVANLCGSHGHKAVALAALGARVAVVDASAGNAAYARELAAAAGLAAAVSYHVADVAELPRRWRQRQPDESAEVALPAAEAAQLEAGGGGEADSAGAPGRQAAEAAPPALAPGGFDLVLMEMGVLHYFLDLRALMRDVVAPLLRPGGRLLLRDFHPVSTKLLSSRGKKHKATGDYFSTQPLAAVDVAYSKYEEEAAAAAASDSDGGGGGGGTRSGAGAASGGGRPTALLRRWGLGEVVSAVGGSGGLRVLLLDEEAGARLDDAGLPKVFTLLAEKPR
ncbi:hypothetical protein GPECTOR_63g28 [Gonium pectorale]|uniref:Uncharacterized protein n=1 Tax=Gonium pectorale TaxID=33097 RepID=A0A150G5U8_GONPE|nr:hypothetical protein GPECTOR_63g28 [Gonium pectorale]|eukprot:KXZ44700.1 hypothetical protein GPECTOR_63g28 [Gonium pectorale]